MSEVKKAYKLTMDSKIGVVFGEQVMQELRHEVYEVLKRHADDLVMYDWTLNDTYMEDGRQVSIGFPRDESFWCDTLDDKVSSVLTCKHFAFYGCMFTDEKDRDEVRELCRKVAIGEIAESEMDVMK
jgi:hypothetical protein